MPMETRAQTSVRESINRESNISVALGPSGERNFSLREHVAVNAEQDVSLRGELLAADSEQLVLTREAEGPARSRGQEKYFQRELLAALNEQRVLMA